MNVLGAAGGGAAAVFVELGAIFLGLSLLARLAYAVGLSPVPFYLVAGVVFGEGGLVKPAFSESFIEHAGNIGVVLLLLMLGLEYSSKELVGALRTGVASGAVDFALNFTPGVVMGVLLGWSAPATFALGGVTYVSSSGIAAKLLGDLGWIGRPETATVLALLVAEDLAMAAYLPVLGVVLAGTSAGAGAIAVAVSLTAVAIGLYVALRHDGVITRVLNAPSDEVVLLSVLGLTLLVAGGAEQLRVSAAVGSFLVGVAISGSLSERMVVLIRPLRDLFAATFFLLFGLRIVPGDIPGVLAPAVVLALVTALTKYAAAWWATRRAGVDRAGRRRAGTVLIARGEFSIVIAGLAVASGLDHKVSALCGTYVLLLAASGPIIARVVGGARGVVEARKDAPIVAPRQLPNCGA